MAVHPVAQAFAGAVEQYEQGRPEYPAAAVAWLREALRLSGGSVVLEVGAGSGKFTRSLVRGGLHPTALEPIGPMRAALHRKSPDVPVLAGRAEELPFRPASADAILVAQAFHWFEAARAVAGFARVLRPGGGVGLVWNARDESVGWVEKLGRIVWAHEPENAPHFRSGAWRAGFEGVAEFSALQERRFAHHHSLTPEAVVARALSVSYIAALPERERADVAEQVRALLRSDPALAGRDRIDFPYQTEVHWARRLPVPSP